MKKLFITLALGLSLLPSLAFAQFNVSYTKTQLPLTDSLWEIGTSTRAYLRGFFDNIFSPGISDGCATWSSTQLISTGVACGSGAGGGTGPATSTDPLMAAYIVSTSTTKTSRFLGPLLIAEKGNGYLLIQPSLSGSISGPDLDIGAGGALRMGAITSSGTFNGGVFQLFGDTHANFAGQLYFDSGDASGNAVIFRTDQNVEAGRFDENQRLGVGTSSPGSILSVKDVGNFGAGTSTIYSNIYIPTITATGTPRFTALTSCDTIDTDQYGNVRCGSDQTGEAGTDSNISSSTNPHMATYYVATGTVATSTYSAGIKSTAFDATGTSTLTSLISSFFRLGTDVVNDITGTGLTIEGGVLSTTLGTSITASELASADFGDFTCNGTTCAFDADTVADSEIDYSVVTLADFTNDAGYFIGTVIGTSTNPLLATIFTATSTTGTSTLPNILNTFLTLGTDTVNDLSGDGLTVIGGKLNSTLGTSIAPTELSATDFGDFTCNGATCALDADTVSDSEVDYTTVTLADFTNDAGYFAGTVIGTSTNPSLATYFTATSTTATSTFPKILSTFLQLGSDTINDLTGSGILATGGALTLDRTGDWTGTLDSIEGASLLRSDTSDNYTSGTLTFDAATVLRMNSTATTSFTGGIVTSTGLSSAYLDVGYIHATSTATSTFAGGLDFTRFKTSATSTGTSGINLTGGCFAINGTCVGGGSGTITGTGVAGLMTAWTSATNITATSSPTVGYITATTTTATSTFNGGFSVGTTTIPAIKYDRFTGVTSLGQASTTPIMRFEVAGGVSVKVGVNRAFGTSTLVGGTVTVNNTLTQADSLIFLTDCVAGGTIGTHSVGTRVAGTSFVINSSNVLDTSTICWQIYNPIY